MEHVDLAAEQRQVFEPIWDEAEANWLVRPLHEQSLSTNTRYPVAGNLRDFQGFGGRTILKDPETHQSVMSIIASIILTVFPEDQFIKAKGKGFEDIHRGKSAAGLIQYFSKLEGHYYSFFEWLLGAGIEGTGIGECFWDYVEQPRTFRTIDADPITGEEFSDTQILTAPVWDDPRFETFDIRDFFPDTGVHQLHRMKGAARRFRITSQMAMQRAEAEIYKKPAVEEAIERRSEEDQKAENEYDPSHDEETDLNPRHSSHPDFLEMTGFRYCGEVPFKSKDGFMRREIVVLNGETVRSEVWPRRLPWFDCKITPRKGSFYGVSPAELIRFDQDFADTLKMMLADAVVRAVHPPNIYDRNAEVDVAKLRRFDPDVPIGANRVDAVQQVPYNPPVAPAFSMYAGIKQQMREGGSATNEAQGIGFTGGVPRSASAALGQFERAGVRPEMFNRVMEREYLPPLGKYGLGLYQEFLEDTEDLANRIGESETTVALADILLDFDIEFIGSRVDSTREQELQQFREIIAASANPIVAQIVPWVDLFRRYFDRLGQHELAAQVANPQMMQLHLLLTQLAGPNQLGGNNNGETPSTPSPGTLPAQAFGGPQG